MLKLGSETNSVLTANSGVEPKVGMGATILMWTDRHAATIVEVSRTKVHVQRDVATRTDKNGRSDQQTCTYAPNPDADVEVFDLTIRGYRSNSNGNGLSIGVRDSYYDYSF